LVDKPDKEPAHSEPKPEPKHQGKDEEFDMERAIQMSLQMFRAQGHARVGGVAIQEPIAEAIRPLPVVEGKSKAIDDTSANIVCDSLSLSDAKTGDGSDKTNSGDDTEILQINEELGEYVEKQVDLEEKTIELDQDQARSDPGETHESRPPPEHVLMDEVQARPDPGIRRMALAGPDLEPTHDEFMATLYPKVQESLKFPTDKHVILED
ncbi:hypothetical protein Tco_0160033, partial [Tanacetum coccineum]